MLMLLFVVDFELQVLHLQFPLPVVVYEVDPLLSNELALLLLHIAGNLQILICSLLLVPLLSLFSRMRTLALDFWICPVG